LPAVARIIDADTHFMEPPGVYLDHVARRDRELALRVEPDERGWPWLVHRGRRLGPMDQHTPGRPDLIGEQRRRHAAGERWREAPAPADACDPRERLRHLAEQGVDGSIVFPNLGLAWEDALRDDLPSVLANCEAYNTWLLEEQLPACDGRLHPVAHLTLRDPDWFDREIERLARGGIRLAMVAAHPVDGRSLAHPDLDRVWARFQDLGVAVCFHVERIRPPLDPAWYALDPAPANKLLDMVFLYLPPALALTSLIVHGTLERFPGLRIGVFELSAGWVPGFLLHLEGACHFYASQNGQPLAELSLRPSEYFKRQVRVNAFPLEGAADLMQHTGPGVFMWGSDYPHAEGMKHPSFRDYLRVQPRALSEPEKDALGGGNAAFLLGEA
jgi:predicted TIM-barrel fold metal-dependent hydrolase